MRCDVAEKRRRGVEMAGRRAGSKSGHGVYTLHLVLSSFLVVVTTIKYGEKEDQQFKFEGWKSSPANM